MKTFFTIFFSLFLSVTINAQNNASIVSDSSTDAVEQYNLGLNYYSGINGVEQDYVEAAKWFRKSAEQGNASAQCSLGKCYFDGLGVTQDYEQAVKWFRKSAEQEHVEGQYNLGLCYYYNCGVPKSYPKAIEWFTKAAKQGCEDSKQVLKLLGQ